MKADIVFWCAIAFMIVCSLYFGPRIRSERIPMQWGFDGKPTWSAPKTLGIWMLVALALMLRLLIWFCVTYIPQSVHAVDIGLIGSSIVLAAAHLFVLVKAGNVD